MHCSKRGGPRAHYINSEPVEGETLPLTENKTYQKHNQNNYCTMDDAADLQTLYQTAMCLNNIATSLQEKKRYLLAHQTLKDAMLCMQLILRPDQNEVWLSKTDVTLKVNVASERIRLVEEQLSLIGDASIDTPSDPGLLIQDGKAELSFAQPIPVSYESLDSVGVDTNSAIIVFNFGLTYVGIAFQSCQNDRLVLYEAAVEFFYLSYSILVKLSVETEELDFCEYILILSIKMLRQTISVDQVIGRDITSLVKLLRNAEGSFSVLHRIGEATVAAAA